MRRPAPHLVASLALLGMLAGRHAPAAAQVTGAGGDAAADRQVLTQYCAACHNERTKNGNLVLDGRDPEEVSRDVDAWERVVKKLKGRVMPPPGSKRPDAQTYDRVIASLEARLDAAAAAATNPGRPLVHRLNRAEYANAIRDLLGLEIDAASLLPADTSGYGFDNVADVLSMSPGLLERYMSAARQVSRRAVGDLSIRAQEHTYRLSLQTWQDDRADAAPFGTRGGLVVDHYFPLTGEYVFRIDFKRGYYDDIVGRHEPNDVDLRIDGVRVQRFRVEPTAVQTVSGDENRPGDGALEVQVPVQAGKHSVSVAIVKRSSSLTEGYGPTRLPITVGDFPSQTATSPDLGKMEMRIATVAVRGPLSPAGAGNTEPRRRIFACHPSTAVEERPCARRILTRLARLGYRRSATPKELAGLLEFYDRGRATGSFDAGIQLALERMLISPAFLVRAERTPSGAAAGSVHAISDLELASRLSFFLWSSIPDEALLRAAEQGRLREPVTLRGQVDRMLADPRAEALIANFFGQWLFLRNLRIHAPDRQVFPDFDEELREAFQRETSLFIASQIRENRSVTELFTADYTFLNERLARHYGIPSIVGSHFRRVRYPDGRRGGLLGHGAILAVTSYTNRTSPVLRGKWLLENVLGTPPPDPPPGVPPLTESVEGKLTSVRARMEYHRRNPVCSTCHAQIDPMGFALENFDGLGAWRERDGDTAIDASGSFPDGAKFNGPETFRRVLLQREGALVTTLTEKLLTYALGRGLEAYDMPAVRAIVRSARAGGFRWSSLVMAIVQSTPFQKRQAES